MAYRSKCGLLTGWLIPLRLESLTYAIFFPAGVMVIMGYPLDWRDHNM